MKKYVSIVLYLGLYAIHLNMPTNCMRKDCELKQPLFKETPKDNQIEFLKESEDQERFLFFFLCNLIKYFVIAREKKVDKDYWLVGGSPSLIKVIYEVPNSDYVICGSTNNQIDIWKVPPKKSKIKMNITSKIFQIFKNLKAATITINILPVHSIKHFETFEDIKINKDVTSILLKKKDYRKEKFTLSKIDKSICPILHDIYFNIQKKKTRKKKKKEFHKKINNARHKKYYSDISIVCDKDNEAHLIEKQTPKYDCSTYLKLLMDFLLNE